MQSFTWGSDEGMKALIEKQAKELAKGEKWFLEPNPADFKTLVDSLRFTADNAAGDNHDLYEAAADLLSSIAESLGIEFI